MEKQDRQGVRTAGELERKYRFGASFAKVLGVAEDARELAQSVGSELRGEMSRQVSALSRTADSITARVERAETAVGALETAASKLNLTADRLTLSLEGVRGGLESNEHAVEELSRHFLFDQDGLTIRDNATGMGIRVSEKEVLFTGGGEPTTVITPNEMQTTNHRVGERLELGAFALLPRTNGNLSMRWTGGNDDTI